MRVEQEEIFWKTIKIFQELGILKYIMLIGSQAEYLYPSLFETDFIPNLKTRDVDFLYRNINIPEEKIPIIQKLKDIGYLYDEDNGISRFYNEDLLELEFLTRILGAGEKGITEIKPLGIKSEGLRVLNILSDYPCEVEKTDRDGNLFTLTVPEPAVYVIQKILTNPTREPPEKKTKDIEAVRELLYHISKSDYHTNKLKEVYAQLTKKQLKIVKSVCEEKNLNLPL